MRLFYSAGSPYARIVLIALLETGRTRDQDRSNPRPALFGESLKIPTAISTEIADGVVQFRKVIIAM